MYRRILGICVLFLVTLLCVFLWQERHDSSRNGYTTPVSGIWSDQAIEQIDNTAIRTPNVSGDKAADIDSQDQGIEINRKQRYHNNRVPIKHIAYLKVHKVASGTMQNLFLRFGIEHDLVFVLPKSGTSLPMSTGTLISPSVLPPPRHRTYDILCNHIRYNHSEFQKTLPADSVYIATVRDPFRQFISSIHYYHRHFMLKIAEQKPILKFLQEPNKYKRIITENGKVSNFYNSMAWDFGFPFQLFVDPDKAHIQKYIEKLDKEFDLVIVVEYFDEGMILMRRLLNWDMRHILYVSSHTQKRPEPALATGAQEEDLYQKWCLLDYALFNFFKGKFLKRWKNALVNSDVMAELNYFREMKSKVNEYCQNLSKQSSLYIKQCQWHAGFRVDEDYCKRRKFGEAYQIENLRKKQLMAARHGN